MAATFLLLLFTFAAVVSAHNITEILSHFPEYTQFNTYLTQTRLADDINSHQTITVLVLFDSEMSSLVANHPLSVIKNVLELHVLLDYYDPKKLHSIANGTTLSTTLYQTTGSAEGRVGFVNITDLRGGVVGFGSAVPGAKLDSTYAKSVKQIPYNISVLEISSPIIAPGILTAPAPTASSLNFTALLDKAGCKTFATLITTTGVLKIYQSQISKPSGALTVFAPTDEAYAAKGVPNLTKLSNAELVSLLQYHALNNYSPKGTLKTAKDPISTLATSGAGKFDLTTSTAGDDVYLHTGVDSARISGVVIDSTPVVIFTVSNVLLPEELFGRAPAPAPGPVIAVPAPAPSKAAPVPAEAPASVASPPAPLTETPEGSPAEAPAERSDESSTGKNGGVARVPAWVVHATSFLVSAIVLVALS
ncbi:Fasciclin-like arabinogalactan protein 8-like protein [Drosera capensis]